MPKLPAGMFKRGPCYYARIYRGGRERRTSLGRDFNRAVLQLHKLRAGVAVRDSTATVSSMGKRWLEMDVQTRRTRTGILEAESRFTRLLDRFLGPMAIDAVRPDDLRAYRIWIERQKAYKPETVRHHLADARRFFNWLADSRYIDRSPFPRGLMPRVPERRPDRLSDLEVQKLLRTPDPYRFTIRLALATGLRWGELTQVQAKDVENGSLVVLAGKTGKVRRIPMPPDLIREIRSRIGRLVPFSRTSKGSFTRIVRRESGVAGFHPHQLRHTAACRWLEQGMSLPAVQELLGHASVITTQRYSRLSDDAVRREMERVWAQTGSLTGSPGSKRGARKRGKFLASVSLGR